MEGHKYVVWKSVLPCVAWIRPDDCDKNLDTAQFQIDKVNEVPYFMDKLFDKYFFSIIK